MEINSITFCSSPVFIGAGCSILSSLATGNMSRFRLLERNMKTVPERIKVPFLLKTLCLGRSANPDQRKRFRCRLADGRSGHGCSQYRILERRSYFNTNFFLKWCSRRVSHRTRGEYYPCHHQRLTFATVRVNPVHCMSYLKTGKRSWVDALFR